MLLCLTGVCLVCGALLSFVYVKTKEPIKEAEIKNIQDGLAYVLPEGCQADINSEKSGTCEIYRASAPDSSNVVAVKSTVTGFGGPLVLMVGICDGKVYRTRVLSHSETPGLGAKCTDEESSFVLQFKDSSAPRLKADGGSLDAMTGCTITSRAYAQAVSNALKAVNGNE